MAGTADDVLRIARAEIGTTSGAKYWDWFFGGGYVNGSATPWCACFVSWVLAQAGVECATFPRATAIDRHDIPSADRVEPKDLKAGDPVGYDWDDDTTGDHQGIFESWVSDTQFYAIEGNTSGGVVARRLRNVSDVTCGVRPRYKDGRLSVDGWIGPQSVSELQTQLGTPVDGVISGQRHSEDEYRSHVVAVEYEGTGSTMVLKMQRFLMARGLYRGGIDGLWGYETTCAVQRYLKGLGYYTGGIDGDFAGHSAECLQRSLNDKKWRS